MAKKDIETELREVLDVHPNKNEDRQKFLFRLMKAAKTCSKKEWDELSDPAGDYANALIDAYDDERKYPEPPDHKGGSNPKETDEMKTPKNAKAGSAKPAGKDDVKRSASPAKKSEAPKGKSSRRKIKEAVVKNPQITVEKLISTYGTGKDALGKEGLSDLSIGSIRSDTLDTLRVAASAGCWKGPSLDKKA